MEARRFGILRELVDALSNNDDALKRGVVQAQLHDWSVRLEALGNAENDRLNFLTLAECGDRAAGGQVDLLNEVLAPNLDKMKQLDQLLQDLGDPAEFKEDLSSLQASMSFWNSRSEVYDKLVKHEFPRKLEVFEQIIQVLRSTTVART